MKIVIDKTRAPSDREAGRDRRLRPQRDEGYHNRDEENDAVFTEDGGFRTGDMGYLDDDGFLYITGRIKEQYKLENGKYVVPTPLEEQLKLSPFVPTRWSTATTSRTTSRSSSPNVDAREEVGRASNGVSDERRRRSSSTNPKVRALFKEEVDKHRREFKGFEGVKDFAAHRRGLHDRERHAHAEPQGEAPQGRGEYGRRSRRSTRSTRRRRLRLQPTKALPDALLNHRTDAKTSIFPTRPPARPLRVIRET